MEHYQLLKYAHLIPAVLLLAGVIAHAFMLWKAHRAGDAAVITRKLRVTRLYSLPALGVLALSLPVSGWWLVHTVGLPLGASWLLYSAVMFGVLMIIGLLLHGSPERYMRAVDISVRGIGGIVLLIPFYAGIMGMMVGANAAGLSLGRQVTDTLIAWSSAESFPVLAFLSAGLVNVFVPSGGGQWAVQGPIMLPAGAALGVAPEVTAMAIAWGDAWTNMIQPFWALPLLGIAGLGARDIMGYCLLCLVFSGVVIAGGLYFLT